MSSYHVGLDIGSTTVKLVVVASHTTLTSRTPAPSTPSSSPAPPHSPTTTPAASPNSIVLNVVFKSYVKHLSDIKSAVAAILQDAQPILHGSIVSMAVTGSGGINVARALGVEFVQEVIACTEAVETLVPAVDVAIELGGEDAKITYFGKTLEQRMNAVCAGGTGAFIDQMGTLLQTDAAGLNALAEKHKMIYPIASRCGVFAKTDVQPLLNEGAGREDVAASVLQAVVNQTIGGLACGKPIRGRVLFLGGPLHFLPQLRLRFMETLHLKPEDAIAPDDAHFFVAIGAALLSARSVGSGSVKPIAWADFCSRIPQINALAAEERRLPPMFATPEEYTEFKERHAQHKVARGSLKDAKGALFLGVDSGSTTTKAALIDPSGKLLWSHYGLNQGNPLLSTTQALLKMYAELPEGAWIGRSCVTGYGEGLVKAALKVDDGEIETIAHFKAAEAFCPGVDFVIDIGGQDMKSLRVRNGAVDSIMLNEACSSGCGSFISTFAIGLKLPVAEFAQMGVESKAPVDLGTRCTVFMNSRVKQAQKEGASVADISGGIALSVIKNALFKVIRMRSPEEMGKKIVVQGGTFYNDAVLRAFEKISGREAIRPDIAGLMGAYGAALIARNNFPSDKPDQLSAVLSAKDMSSFSCQATTRRCGKCANNCLLTLNKFNDGGLYISGNRCERGASLDKNTAVAKDAPQIPNLYQWKLRHVFKYAPLTPAKATRGDIGIPRVLNMYEDYPFWHTLLTSLGFRVLLSLPTTKAIFEEGMETIPSDTVCYPAKLVHGHIEELVRRGLKNIWLPCIPLNIKEDLHAANQYNCPVVGNYPEVARVNCDTRNGAVQLCTPFLPMGAEPEKMAERILAALNKYHLGAQNGVPPITLQNVTDAVIAGYAAAENYRSEVRQQGEEALKWMADHKARGVVILGRPYHIDPEINHGVPELLTGFGLAVLCEDAIAHLGRNLELAKPLRVVDQWTYHARLYSAARFAVTQPTLDILQLVSFGCGLDAITTDQIKEITEGSGRLFTNIKIDEISNLGAARIRIRSMLAAIRERELQKGNKITLGTPVPVSSSAPSCSSCKGCSSSCSNEASTSAAACSACSAAAQTQQPHTPALPRPVFPAGAKENGWTILIPMFSPFHMRCLMQAMHSYGYRGVLLEEFSKDCIDEGLKYVHNDACFPAICVIGQMIHAVKSGKYDVNKTALFITQTGGACRATNYVSFLEKALHDAGYPQIPIISLNAAGLGYHPGWKINSDMLVRAVFGLFIGDIFMSCVLRTRPYEIEKGSAMKLYKRLEDEAVDVLMNKGWDSIQQIIHKIVTEFDKLPLTPEGDGLGKGRRPRVGIVGEILVKYHDDSNNHLVEYLESEGAEVMLHGLLDFFTYCALDDVTRYNVLAGTWGGMMIGKTFISFIETGRAIVNKELSKSHRFHVPPPIMTIASLTSRYVSICIQAGEGWFLVGEILSMLEDGIPNVLCLQPFGCLPNHVTGRGMARLLRTEFPDLNMGAIDYDPGTSEINQINRVKLLLTVAKRRQAMAHAMNTVSSPITTAVPDLSLSPSTSAAAALATSSESRSASNSASSSSAPLAASPTPVSPNLLSSPSPLRPFTPGPSGDAVPVRKCLLAAAAASGKGKEKVKEAKYEVVETATATATVVDVEDIAGVLDMDPKSRAKNCSSCQASCNVRVSDFSQSVNVSETESRCETATASSHHTREGDPLLQKLMAESLRHEKQNVLLKWFFVCFMWVSVLWGSIRRGWFRHCSRSRSIWRLAPPPSDAPGLTSVVVDPASAPAPAAAVATTSGAATVSVSASAASSSLSSQ